MADNSTGGNKTFLDLVNEDDSLDDFKALNPGYIFRPLANEYVFPARGNEPHGIDNTIKSDDYTPPDFGPAFDKRPAKNDNPDYAQIEAPKPLPVAVMNQPFRSFLYDTNYTVIMKRDIALPGSVTVGQLDMVNAHMAFGYDDTRESVTFFPNGGSFNWIPAISKTPDFTNFVPLIPFIQNGQNPITVYGKTAIYVAAFYIGTTYAAPAYDWYALSYTKRLVNVNP